MIDRPNGRQIAWRLLAALAAAACLAAGSPGPSSPPAAVRGRVTDSAGRPIAGARVTRLPAPSTPGEEVLTNQAGRFSLAGLHRGVRYAVAVRKEGYVPLRLSDVAAPAATPLRVTLIAIGEVAGRLVDERGKPVPHAAVALVRGTRTFRGLAGSGQRLTSDAQGRYRLDHLEPGPVTLQAVAPGTLAVESAGFELVAGGGLAIPDLVLPRGAAIEGRVTTADGRPAPGARVRRTDGRTGFLPDREAVAGGDGTYRLAGLPEGRQRIVVEHSDHPAGSASLDVRGGINHLDLQLGEGYAVSGVVTGGDGRPLAGAALTLSATAGEHRTESAADGAFAWTGIPDGTYRLDAAKPGYAPVRLDRLRIDGTPVSGIDLRLEAGSAVCGQILGLGAADLAQVRVVAEGGAGTTPAVAALAVDGTYRIEHLGPGDWSVTAIAGSGRSLERGVTLTPELAEARLDLDFGGLLAFTGRVRVAGRVPAIAEVQLRSLGPGRFLGSSPVDEEGSFRLGGVPPGSYTLEVVAAGARPLRRTLDLETDDDATFDLPPAAGPRLEP